MLNYFHYTLSSGRESWEQDDWWNSVFTYSPGNGYFYLTASVVTLFREAGNIHIRKLRFSLKLTSKYCQTTVAKADSLENKLSIQVLLWTSLCPSSMDRGESRRIHLLYCKAHPNTREKEPLAFGMFFLHAQDITAKTKVNMCGKLFSIFTL